MDRGKVVYFIASMIIPIVSIVIWSAVIKKTKDGNICTKRECIFSGVFFGIISILINIICSYAAEISDTRLVFGSCGLMSLSSGLCFGTATGAIASAAGIAYELFGIIRHEANAAQLCNTICLLFAALNVWYIKSLILKGKSPSLTIGIISSIALSAFNHLVYMITEFVSYDDVLMVTKAVIISSFGINLLQVSVSQLLSQKILNGRFFLEPVQIRTLIKLKQKLILSFAAVILIMTTFLHTYISIALWRPVEQWIDDDFNHISTLLHKEQDADKWDADSVPTPYMGGRIIVADKNGKIIYGDLWNSENISQTGISIDDDSTELRRNYYSHGSENFVWAGRKTDGYSLIEIIPTTVVYASRNTIVMIAVCTEFLLVYALVLIALLLIDREIISKTKEMLAKLGNIMGSRYKDADDAVYHLFDVSVMNDLNKLTGQITDEMSFAANVQMQSLPVKEMMTSGVGISAMIRPARQVGGDFYDYFALDSSRELFLIADVSGKGMSAAMFMMKAKAAVRSLAYDEYDMEKLLAKVNEALCSGNPEGMFVAMWIGIIDLDKGQIQYINSAMGNQVIKKPQSRYEFIDDVPEVPLGVLEGKKYHVRTLEFKPGSRLLLYSDGVSDANNADEKMYTEEKIVSFLNENCTLTKGIDTVNMLRDDLMDHIGDAEQFDDITLLAVDYFGDIEHIAVVSRVFEAEDEKLDEAEDFINSALEDLHCSDEQMMEIDVAFEELFVNISHHAYRDTKGTVKVEVSTDNALALIRLTDSGIPFNPLRQPRQDEDTPLEERKEGGLGITMVKACMNYLDYDQNDGKNVVTMIKFVG